MHMVVDMSDHGSRLIERHCDVAIVGGSAAGLAAGLQLGRQRRSVIVVDAGDPRNAPAAHMHSYLGHEGLPPSELSAIGREEVRSYGGEVLAGRAVDVTRLTDRMEKAQLVVRSDCPEDGRGTVCQITDAGRRLRARMWPVYKKQIEALFGKHLGVKEAQNMAASLDRIISSARAAD